MSGLVVQVALLAVLGGGDGTLALVRAGRVGHAYARLTNELGNAGHSSRTDFLAALLRVLRCAEPLPPVASAGGGDGARGYEQAQRLLLLEYLRAERMYHADRLSGAYLYTSQGRLDWSMDGATNDAITWPLEAERWSDESDVPAPPPERCHLEAADGVPVDSRAELRRELATARALAAQLPSPALQSAVLFDAALLADRLGDEPAAEWAATLLAPRLDSRSLADSERAEAGLLVATIGERHLDPAAALARWDRAARWAPAAWRPLIDLHRQRLQVSAGQLADAMATLSRYVDGHDELATYFGYRLAQLAAQGHDEAALFKVARVLLGGTSKRRVASQPPLRAVQALAFTALLRHDVDDATVELLESFGPVAELYARMEAFAEFALQHERAGLALALYDRLLAARGASHARPYYLSGLAVAAVMAGDAARLRFAYGALAGELRSRGERGHGLEWDRQLLLATRQAVAFLGPRPADERLKVLVNELQPLLRDAPGPYQVELTQLYRLASSRLRLGARGYAESIGDASPPLWLGDIQVAKPELDVREPELPMPELSGPTTLIALPDAAGALQRWWGPAHPAEDMHAQ